MNLLDGTVGTTVHSVTLKTSTVAETFVGGTLTGSARKDSASSAGRGAIVLVHEPEGTAGVGVFDLTNANPLWSVDRQVLWSKVYEFTDEAFAIADRIDFEAKIKTMRKLKVGDRISLKSIGSLNNIATLFISSTMFYKQ